MRPLKIIVLIVLSLLLLGCTVPKTENNGTNENPRENLDENLGENLGENIDLEGSENMVVIENGDTVKVEYVGKFPDGEEFDKSEGRGPLEFVAGTGQMIKGFDDAVIGMKQSEEKTVTIPPEDAYGLEGDGQSTTVPLEQISGEEEIKVGATLYSSSGQQGTVTAIENGMATVVFSHPMAGKTLVFWIKIVGIEKA